jgi:hypothetical protein
LSLSIIDDVEWTDPNSDIPRIKHWLRSDVLPLIGQTRVVLIKHELPQASRQNILFTPALSSLNGLDDSLSEIDNCFVTDCDLELLEPAPSEFPNQKYFWCKASIQSLFNISEFRNHIAATNFDFYDYGIRHTSGLFRYKSWLYLSINIEGDLGARFLFLKESEKLTLVYAHEWLFSDYKACITNCEVIGKQRELVNRWIDLSRQL